MKDNVVMKFDTWRRFYKPYFCFCCDKEISKEQFMFSCLCGYCDLGKCGSRLFSNQEKGHRNKEAWKNAEIVTELAVADSL